MSNFQTTRWSLVVDAGATEGPSAALDELCGAYWVPLYAFARRSGHREADAQDLVQGFFARLIEKGYLADADRDRGRFRTFLLAACRCRSISRTASVAIASSPKTSGPRKPCSRPAGR